MRLLRLLQCEIAFAFNYPCDPPAFSLLILEPGTDRILGVGIAGHGAGELIGEAVLAVEMQATAKDLALTVHAHPTLSETLMEAAEVFYGHATHVFVKPAVKA